MPMYEFESVELIEGERRYAEQFHHMSEAPPLDSVIEIGGHQFKRIASMPVGVRATFTPFASDAAYRNDPLAPRCDDQGRPVFNTQGELDTYIKAQKDDPERRLEFTRD